MVKETCDLCLWCKKYEPEKEMDDMGTIHECRRLAPIGLPDTYSRYWPIVAGDDWCGEWALSISHVSKAEFGPGWLEETEPPLWYRKRLAREADEILAEQAKGKVNPDED